MLLLVKETSKLELHNYLGTDFLMLFALHLGMGGGRTLSLLLSWRRTYSSPNLTVTQCAGIEQPRTWISADKVEVRQTGWRHRFCVDQRTQTSV